MKLLLTIGRQWRTLLAALLLAGVVHIATVLALPSFYRSDAYTRLARNLPANSFVTLPVAQPKAQVLPFQTPDTRYAVCRFDATAGPVAVRATLPEAGWSLSLYTASGEGFYTFPAADQRPVTLSLVVVPPGEKFLGSSSDARGQDLDATQIVSPNVRGLAVLRAPLFGRSFAAAAVQHLAQATCRQLKY